MTTPVLVPSPGLEVHIDAFEVGGDERCGGSRWLSPSPELQMKRLLADGYDRIFQLTPCFRRGERGERHNPEFTMLEWYRANAGINDVVSDTEQLVASVTGGHVVVDGTPVDVTPPLDRMSVCEAFARHAGWSRDATLAAAAHDEASYFRTLVDVVEPALARHPRGVFLVDYPASQASLARRSPADPAIAERFELYVAGVELCNGFGELVDAAEQRSRLERDQATRRAAGKPVYPIDTAFLDAVARMPPSAGNALGLERLVAIACGTAAIASVLAFTDEEL